jgi:hypothetical protein
VKFNRIKRRPQINCSEIGKRVPRVHTYVGRCDSSLCVKRMNLFRLRIHGTVFTTTYNTTYSNYYIVSCGKFCVMRTEVLVTLSDPLFRTIMTSLTFIFFPLLFPFILSSLLFFFFVFFFLIYLFVFLHIIDRYTYNQSIFNKIAFFHIHCTHK